MYACEEIEKIVEGFSCDECDNYNEVLKKYNQLIESGLTEPRRSQLKPIEQTNEFHFSDFND